MQIRSWNPFRLNMMCYAPEGVVSSAPAGGDSSTASPAGGSTSEAAPGGDSSSSSSDSFENSFSGLDGDFDPLDSIDLGDSATGTDPGAAPSEPGAQVVPPVAAKVEPPAQQVPAAPAAQQPVVEPAPAQAPSAPRSAREELDAAVNDMKGGFKELVEWATPELFSLTKEEIESLDTNAVEMIPKLMSRTYTQALLASLNMMRNFVPRMITEGFAQQTTSAAKANDAKSAFYKAWPELNEKDHDQAMNTVAKVFRQMNPKASREEAIKFVGAAVLAQFGLSRGTPKASAAPARPAPFQPARPGGRQVAQTPVDNPWDGLDADIDDSE